MADTPVKADNTAPAAQPSVEADGPPTLPLASTPPTQPDTQPSQWRRLQRPRTRPACPDRGSLFDILRENSGSSLFVLPILWTDAHPRLLGARFVAQEPILNPTPSSSSGSRPGSSSSGSSATLYRPSEIAETLSYDLTSLLSPEDTRPFSKSRAIKNVMTTLFKASFSRPRSVAELDMHFGGRIYRSAVRVPVLWKSAEAADSSSFDSAVTRPLSSFGHASNAARETNDFNGFSSVQSSQGVSDGPIIAYVNRSHLSMIRKNLFRIVPGPVDGDRCNTPVSRLQALRSKLLLPAELDHDAYLTGVFIAMAQSHFYESPPSRMASQVSWWNSRHRGDGALAVHEFHDLKLRILTHDDETSDFIVYMAVVTAAFLKRFAEPLKAVENAEEQAGLDIEYTRVPVWPILGLRERLGKALGRDLVGDVQEATDLFHEEVDKDDAKDDAKDDTDANSTSDDVIINSATTENATEDDDTDRAARYKEAQEAAGHQRSQERSLKRKRTDKASLSDILSVSFGSEGKGSVGSVNGAVGDHRSSTIVEPSPAVAAAVAITSPTLSPHKKRRQARRSLSSSSLAVF
ncbi:hypothetical protein SCUCBS95973_002665 [Sporothrix curviconia]|uniref:Uncharacterized protein n=1 Tax=Sporothrix curviconia TaxID=1260050 RepID=A0ABP0B913_9PEZI